jgi:hypothetical protein
MKKFNSDHSNNHSIAGKVNSGSIKQFHTYTGNFSFKFNSDHSNNHSIAGKVNSGSIKQFHTYTGNFSFKISFLFL